MSNMTQSVQSQPCLAPRGKDAILSAESRQKKNENEDQGCPGLSHQGAECLERAKGHKRCPKSKGVQYTRKLKIIIRGGC